MVPVKSSSVHGRFHFIFRRRVVLVGLAVSLVLAALVWWNIWFQPKDARVERIRQNGYPATLAEWDAWYRAVPADENRAISARQNRLGQILVKTNHLFPQAEAILKIGVDLSRQRNQRLRARWGRWGRRRLASLPQERSRVVRRDEAHNQRRREQQEA